MNPKSKIMCVIKADAYGNGANTLADLYKQNGATCFAVSNLVEAIKLRRHGISENILILGYTPADNVGELSSYNITQAVYCLDYAKELSYNAEKAGVVVKAHLKLDTGMGRIGIVCNNSDYKKITDCLALPALDFEGVFTHFAVADSIDNDDVAFTQTQNELFFKTVERLEKDGYTFKYIHSSNSAAITRNTKGNLIRPGIILYGYSPNSNYKLDFDLKPVMTLKSVISMIKEIDAGDTLSYGRTYRAKEKRIIATLPIGYADGYPRVLSNKGNVIINGKLAPIVGRICMDQMTVDVTDIKDIEIGTEVTVIGKSCGISIDFDSIANACGTITYEILCNISTRVPRVYLKDNTVFHTEYLGGKL